MKNGFKLFHYAATVTAHFLPWDFNTGDITILRTRLFELYCKIPLSEFWCIIPEMIPVPPSFTWCFSKWLSRARSEIWPCYPFMFRFRSWTCQQYVFCRRTGWQHHLHLQENDQWTLSGMRRFPQSSPIAGTFPGEAASLPVFPSGSKRYACPAAARDFLLSPRTCSLQARQDSSVKVTGRASGRYSSAF